MTLFRRASLGRLDVNGKPFLIWYVWYRATANIRALYVGNQSASEDNRTVCIIALKDIIHSWPLPLTDIQGNFN